ncbi:TPM domain-containing protein [Limnohabitans radicicola]|uniref:YgcG family protein n=1 Tax=Limnohabitans radicicola TaxID=2771427 RepID=A0A927FJM6_9BURK|nr:YgcG family protein [Limnohabitans radicicola]MBD8051298.1 YgcG family protein [Limnohabitans radicicola]
MIGKGVIYRFLIACWLSLALFAPYVAKAQVAVPPLVGHVTDQTGTLTQDQKTALEQTLSAFEARKGSQLAVLIIPTTAPEGIEQYALRVAEQWKLGRQKVDDGAILVVAKDDRTVRIEVGYGLEGALSDITSKRIISEVIVPHFKRGDFFQGLQSGVGQIISVIDGEPLPEHQRHSKNSDQGLRQLVPFLMIVSLGVGSVLRSAFGRVGGSLVTGMVVTGLAWLVVGSLLLAIFAGIAAMFVTLIGASTVLHGLGGMSGGGRHGWGGGGFRGGGGGFGGGGASGRW